MPDRDPPDGLGVAWGLGCLIAAALAGFGLALVAVRLVGGGP